MIKVFTTPTCIYCHALMNWLDEEGIDYKEVDATTEPGITSVPVTVVTDSNDHEIARVIGFDRPAIKKALSEAKNA